MSANAATLEEERREVFDGVLESLRAEELDDDRLAACVALLRHLTRGGRQPAERRGPFRVS
jgi:hypothetical protein